MKKKFQRDDLHLSRLGKMKKEEKEMENKPKSWEKEKLRHLISEVHHANEGPHSSPAIIDATTDFLDDLHNLGVRQARQEGIEEVVGEVRKIMADYQRFKIGVLGLEVKMCEVIEKFELKKKEEEK